MNRLAIACALPVLVCLPAATAAAAEGEKAFGVGVDFSTWNVTQEQHEGTDNDSISAHGASAVADFEYGWNDTFWLRASASGGFYSVPAGVAWSSSGTLGASYAFDLLHCVPFAELSAGALVVGGDGVDVEVKPILEGGIGMNILHSRTMSYGLVLRGGVLFSEGLFFMAGPRVTWRWGYF